jgi:hypothetical protein
MARGNQGRPDLADDPERRRFPVTLGEACGKTGWRKPGRRLERLKRWSLRVKAAEP